jgi:flagellar hook-basal body complex protein FliE
MDGLTISDSNRLLETGRTASELRNERMNAESGASGEVRSFADTLKAAVNSVNELSQESNEQLQKLATGENKNIPEVMIAAEKSAVAFKLLMQVRNKMIEAYQEVMKMQV